VSSIGECLDARSVELAVLARRDAGLVELVFELVDARLEELVLRRVMR